MAVGFTTLLRPFGTHMDGLAFLRVGWPDGTTMGNNKNRFIAGVLINVGLTEA